MSGEKRTLGPLVEWGAEGARVGLVTCLSCGAAILFDPCDDFNAAVDLHEAWHLAIAAVREHDNGD